MFCCALLSLSPLWILSLTQSGTGEELPREAPLSWFTERVLEGLGLEEPPVAAAHRPDGGTARTDTRRVHRRALRTSKTASANYESSPSQEIILFPSSDSCATADSAPRETTNNHLMYYFQPSMNKHETVVTSAHFWFYAGESITVNSSAPLFILPSGQKLLHVAQAGSKISDGWITYHLDENLLSSVFEGPFLVQVLCLTCRCHPGEPDKISFLHLHVHPRGPVRLPRHAPLTIPWSASAIELLQRPSQDKTRHNDCHRAEIEISFEELGWDNWIVHPKVVTFYYCHGNCSAWDRTTAMLGITQCCAPVPGSMKSLRITTTSDGGYSFKYETLPNIIPEECTCI